MKKIFLLILLAHLTLNSKTYLIKTESNEIGKSFLDKSKKPKNKLLDAKQSSILNKFYTYQEVSEDQLKSLKPNNYELIEEISYLKVDNLTPPNDPRFNEQWAIKNTKFDKAWEIATGNGVIIAVIDTGIDYEHEDLKNSLWINSEEDLNNNGTFEPWLSDSTFNGVSGDFDGIDNDGNGFEDDVIGFDFIDQELLNFGDSQNPDGNPDDEQNHGTSVSGVIAATQNNELGITGGAFNSKIMTLRAFDVGGVAESDDVARSIIYAALNGADIINMSFGEDIRSPIVAEAVRFAYAMGCFMVSSAGNSNDFDPHYPSDLPEVMSIAGTNSEDERYSFSNYGSYIDMAAPGSSILTASIGSEYREVNGTSFSAPYVASVAALLLEKKPDLSIEQIRGILISSAFDLGNNGWDTRFGAGLLDARKALQITENIEYWIDHNLFDRSINSDDNDSLSIIGTIALPLLEDYKVYIGEGHFPDHLSSNDIDFLVDTLNRRDSLQALETGSIFIPYNRQSFVNPDQEIIEEFKWDSVFYSDEAVVNSEIFKLFLSDKKDTSYTIRIVANLRNGKSLEKRTKINIFNSNSNLEVLDYGFEYMLHNGNIRPLLYAVTNKASFMNIKAEGFSSSNSAYKSQFHSKLIEDNINLSTPVELNFNREGEIKESVSFSIPDNYSSVDVNTFERVSNFVQDAYIANIVDDLDNDENPDIILNDLTTLAIDKTLHYEYEQGSFILKNETEETWLPVGFGDSDGDGIKEILTTAGFEVKLYEYDNETSNPFENVLFLEDVELLWAEAFVDFDGDGKDELLVNDQSRYYLLKNVNGSFEEIASADLPIEIQGFGVERLGAVGDLDDNGSLEICISNQFGNIFIYEFIDGSSPRFNLKETILDNVSLSRQSLEIADLDNDGIKEIVSLNNGSSGIFGSERSLDEFWRLRVFKTNGLRYDLDSDQYIYGVRDGLIGSSGVSYRNGMATGNLDSEPGDEIVVSTFPNLYVFKYDEGLKPIWHLPNALSNTAIIYDFNGNGINELGINTFGGLAFYEINESNSLQSPTNFQGYALGENSADLFWDSVESATNYEVWRFTGTGNEISRDFTVNKNTINISGLENNTEYRYVVRACNGPSCSEFSNNIVSIFTHTPIFPKSYTQINSKTLLVKYSGKLSLKEPSPELFNLNYLDFILRPNSVIRSSDSTLLIRFDSDLEAGNPSLVINSFRDFYNTLTLESSLQIQILEEPESKEMYIKNYEIQGSSLIGIQFSEKLDSTAEIESNYIIEPFGSVLSVSILQTDSSKIQIFLSSNGSYSRGKDYSLTAKNLFSQDGIPITEGPGSTISFVFSRSILNDVYIYPHPVSRSNSEYYFANLTRNSIVRIFNYEGRKLQELTENDGNGGVEWDGTDEAGRFLEPGIYFWQVEDLDGGQKSDLRKLFVK